MYYVCSCDKNESIHNLRGQTQGHNMTLHIDGQSLDSCIHYEQRNNYIFLCIIGTFVTVALFDSYV